MRFIKKLVEKLSGTDTQNLYREWDRQREAAFTPSMRSEIDAIFSRNL
jgi:hypothetical protein